MNLPVFGRRDRDMWKVESVVLAFGGRESEKAEKPDDGRYRAKMTTGYIWNTNGQHYHYIRLPGI